MDKIIIGIIIAMVLWFFYSTSKYTETFNNWTRDCIQKGGFISQTRHDFFSTNYECFVDGKIIIVPGYEGY